VYAPSFEKKLHRWETAGGLFLYGECGEFFALRSESVEFLGNGGHGQGIQGALHTAFSDSAGYVGINFGGGDVGVSEQFLDGSQVFAIFKEVSGEAVPEDVRGDSFFDCQTLKSANKASILTPEPPRVQSAMIIQPSTQKSERALGQA
jgi:hypothetical protein